MLSKGQARIPRIRQPCHTCLLSLSRNYAISVKPSVVFPGKPAERNFEARKTYLYNQYTSILRSTLNSPLILLHHNNFVPKTLIKLRREIEEASMKNAPSLADGDVQPKRLGENDKATMTVIRTAIFGVVLRNYAQLDDAAINEIAGMSKGGFAVLSLPSLHPPQLNGIFKAFERAVPPVKKTGKADVKKKDPKAVPDDFVPGRRPKRFKPKLVPELSVLGAIIEGRVFKVDQVKDISNLPPLDMLRAQIVGLISSPAAQLAAVLSEASGGQLARTLDGFRRALEEEQNVAQAEDKPNA